jgi:hypothetical protein
VIPCNARLYRATPCGMGSVPLVVQYCTIYGCIIWQWIFAENLFFNSLLLGFFDATTCIVALKQTADLR